MFLDARLDVVSHTLELMVRGRAVDAELELLLQHAGARDVVDLLLAHCRGCDGDDGAVAADQLHAEQCDAVDGVAGVVKDDGVGRVEGLHREEVDRILEQLHTTQRCQGGPSSGIALFLALTARAHNAYLSSHEHGPAVSVYAGSSTSTSARRHTAAALLQELPRVCGLCVPLQQWAKNAVRGAKASPARRCPAPRQPLLQPHSPYLTDGVGEDKGKAEQAGRQRRPHTLDVVGVEDGGGDEHPDD